MYVLTGAGHHPEGVGEGQHGDGGVDRQRADRELAPARLNISISCAAAEKAYGTSVVMVASTMILTNVSDSDDW